MKKIILLLLALIGAAMAANSPMPTYMAPPGVAAADTSIVGCTNSGYTGTGPCVRARSPQFGTGFYVLDTNTPSNYFRIWRDTGATSPSIGNLVFQGTQPTYAAYVFKSSEGLTYLRLDTGGFIGANSPSLRLRGSSALGGNIYGGVDSGLAYDATNIRLYVGNKSKYGALYGANGQFHAQAESDNPTIRWTAIGEGNTNYAAFDVIGCSLTAPCPVKNGRLMGSMLAVGTKDSSLPGVGSMVHGGAIDLYARGDWSETNRGTRWEIRTVPLGTTDEHILASFTDKNLDILGTQIVGLEGNRAGAISGLNIIHNTANMLTILRGGVGNATVQFNETPKRLDFVDVDNSGAIPLSISMNGSGVTSSPKFNTTSAAASGAGTMLLGTASPCASGTMTWIPFQSQGVSGYIPWCHP